LRLEDSVRLTDHSLACPCRTRPPAAWQRVGSRCIGPRYGLVRRARTLIQPGHVWEGTGWSLPSPITRTP